MRFYLNFKSDNYGKKKIEEPFGTDGIKFSLKQKTDGGGMARDISFSGGDIQFEFTDMREHELKQLLYYHRKFGFESVVVLTLEIDENNSYNCDLDFATADTDDLTYFRCKGIEDGKLQIIKARKKVKVDMLSDKNVDGDFIAPLVPQNMLLLAKPVIQSSKWEQLNKSAQNRKYAVEFINPCISLIQYNIEDSYTFFQSESNNSSDFKVLKAKNNLKNVNVTLNKIKIEIPTRPSGGLFYLKLIVAVGNDINNIASFSKVFINETLPVSSGYSYNSEVLNCIIPEIKRDESLYIYFRLEYNGVTTLGFYHDISLESTLITAESTAYNSISKSLRLVDVMAQVIKSISGLEINAQRFQSLGEFYDNRLVNGDFLRGIDKNGFKISLEDIEQSFPEFKGDYEIGSDGKVFFGIEKDYYTPIESGFFNNTQFKEMNKTFNPKYTVNEFNYKYKNYQSLKENEEPNSADTIHGESKFAFFNKSVENKKEVEVEWTRDAFLIEETRKKALVIDENTASQNDDTIFAIDSIDTAFDNTFTEVTNLQHNYDTSTARLTLRNDGNVNFIGLGIIVDSIFTIQPTDANAGTYRVFAVTSNSLELTRLVGIVSPIGDGLRQTKYTYTLEQSFVPFTNYTNQGFSETENLNASNSYSNRRYSIKRNIYNYWKSYLATCNLYWKERPLINTWYKNNGDYTTKYNGIKLTEKADIIPDNPILTPMIYNNIVFKDVDFVDFIALQNNIRSERGFIRTIDNNQQVIKVYPIDMEYSLLEKELKIKAEEKFEPTSMIISTEFDYILINNETRVLSLQWEIISEKLYIYDENSYRLYNGVYWMEVSINGAIPNSIEQLKEWLSLVN